MTAEGESAVVVWSGTGPLGAALLARAVGADGSLSAAVETLAAARQVGAAFGAPCVAGPADGRLAVAEQTDGITSDIVARSIDARGRAAGPVFRLAPTASASRPRLPRVIGLPAPRGDSASASYVIVWTDWLPGPAALRAVWCRSSGAPLDAPVTLRRAPEGSMWPDMCALDRHTLLLAWVEGDWPARVMAAPLRADGSHLGDAFELSDGARTARRSAVRLAAARGGQGPGVRSDAAEGGAAPRALAIAAWTEGRDGVSRTICRFTGPRGPLSPEIEADDPSPFHELAPAVALDAARCALCLWERQNAIRARWLLQDGAAASPFVVAAGDPTVPQSPSVCSTGETGVLRVAWSQGESRAHDEWSIPVTRMVCRKEMSPAGSPQRVAAARQGTRLQLAFVTAGGRAALVASGPAGEEARVRLYDVAGRLLETLPPFRFGGEPKRLDAFAGGRGRLRGPCVAVLEASGAQTACLVRAVALGPVSRPAGARLAPSVQAIRPP